MDTDNRPLHHSSSSHTSELFICFTSRLSSSSMKLSSKSILSPARARDSSAQLSLSLSSSRRLKNSGSLKASHGQASPMFPTVVGKKRGCAFENPEPSSPKVTCIGQVRVKTKKQGKRLIKSKRRQAEVLSFRSNSTLRRSHSLQHQPECLPQRNQKWVHLPMTICDALRAVGSEFNCFLPCRSSCMSSSEASEKDNKSGRSGHETSCGAVFARWLMSLHEGDVKEREINFVVAQQEEANEDEFFDNSSTSRRRHVFEDIEINEDDKFEQKEAKVSICVPPKNALLLMRCRSDPVKMEALASRFCESKVTKHHQEEENEECVETAQDIQVKRETQETQVVETKAEHKPEERHEIDEEEQVEQTTSVSVTEETKLCDEAQHSESPEIEEQESSFTRQSSEQDENEVFDQEDEEDSEPSLCSSFLASLLHSESDSEKEEDRGDHEELNQEQAEVEVMAQVDADPDKLAEPETVPEPEEKPSQESQELPDCLVLMMREPKLSMEVSKETWVCSTDFIRWQPAIQVTDKTESNGSDEQQLKNRVSIDSVSSRKAAQQLQQPPRSSCHYPSSVSTRLGAEPVIEQKLVGSCGKAYERFVLTRCKSEPMRSSGKLKPHGVGAAGVGF